MTKRNIPQIYKHGIEIVKPWSNEMYDYNERIKEIMYNEIKFSIDVLTDIEVAKKLGKIVNAYGYGHGFELESMKEDMLKSLECFENHWYYEIWDELIEADFVKPIFGEDGEVYNIIGFESSEEIKELRIKFSK
jgi:hypothetical protein